MACLFDYLSWRGDLDFKASPFNPVDNIIFSQLSYLTLDGIVPGPEEKDGISIGLAVRIYNEKLNSDENFIQTSIFKEDPELLRALGSSRRFGNCQLHGFINRFDVDSEIQFSALCIYTGEESFVAFRGTDSSIIGWKEDFNMCFKETIPSQIEAVNYLEKMAPMIKGKLRIGGHSKGGNLAIYAASQCRKKIQRRILKVYNNDGPGFHTNILSSEGFAAIKDKIHSYMPQSSVIGMLMEHGNNYTVIKSSESSLLMQHCLYSWEVTHNDLVYAEKFTAHSRFINKTIKEWLNSHDNAQREQFIEALYHVISVADVKTVNEIESSWFLTVGKILKSLSYLDESTRKFIRKTIVELFRSAGRNIDTLLKQDE